MYILVVAYMYPTFIGELCINKFKYQFLINVSKISYSTTVTVQKLENRVRWWPQTDGFLYFCF